jgi:tRNA (cmo5U34)-methyltransferase
MSVDQTVPNGPWAFDAEVAHVFDDMLARSIPGYSTMRLACFDVGKRYTQSGTAIVDLGCSRGEALAPFIGTFGDRLRYVGCEISDPMLAASRERYTQQIADGWVDIRSLDLRTAYPPERASLTLCVLTLQFTPIEYRQQILRRAYEATAPGGAFILVEKILGADADIDAMMVDLYYTLKANNGYTKQQIDRKRWSLEGVLVPVTAKWNEELLSMAGFRHIDCFWRWMNFAAWVAVKERG